MVDHFDKIKKIIRNSSKKIVVKLWKFRFHDNHVTYFLLFLEIINFSLFKVSRIPVYSTNFYIRLMRHTPVYKGPPWPCFSPGLEFQSGIRAQNLEIPSKTNREGGRLPPWKILSSLEIFVFMKRNSPFLKNSPIFVYLWQFLSVRGNFLLSIGGHSFPIFLGIESNSIRKFGT